MDPLHLCIALGPLTIYVVVLGAIHFKRRPYLVTGFRDNVMLGLGILGFVVVGPMELFYPDSVPALYGSIFPAVIGAWLGVVVWILLLALYLLSVLWIALSAPPRLVIYNLKRQQFWPLLKPLIHELDPQAQQVGDMVSLPNLGVYANVDSVEPMRCVQLKSVGRQQDFEGWRQVHLALNERLMSEQLPLNPGAIPLFLLAAGSLLYMLGGLLRGGQHVPQALIEMLRL